ncbi:PaaI family thioesterase [Blastococcus sp. TF02A-30]|uniref:PaaI family thioesterase n=1 Tax=Blastococcus sp. TF02A-30 TaxID=2250580 RepID=UPI000DEA9799|nr:PaaI family thioesterase [Blastococcus sp. TF02A-30]RBY89482.1 aromatic compound degradation protein PaaI [Blastococcus sp. TF02A-30]
MNSDSWGEPRSRTVTWHDPMLTAAGAAKLSGLAAMEAIRDGVLPPPPIAMLVQMGITSVEEGRVEFTCAVDESVYNPIGVVHGGLVCTVLDTVAGCAVHTTLPAGVGYTSIELKVSYLRAVEVGSGPLTATGRVVKPGRRVAFAEGEVTDAAGRTVATASSSLLVFPLPRV